MILARDLDPPLPHLTSSENYQHKRLGSRFKISLKFPESKRELCVTCRAERVISPTLFSYPHNPNRT